MEGVEFNVSDVVRCCGGKNRVGVVKYIGSIDFQVGTWVGVELFEPHGKTNGTWYGKQYFSCSPMHGVWLTPGEIKEVVLKTDPSPSEDPVSEDLVLCPVCQLLFPFNEIEFH